MILAAYDRRRRDALLSEAVVVPTFASTKSVLLNGTNKYLSASTFTSLNGQSKATVSLWCKRVGSGATHTPLAHYLAAGNQRQFQFQITDTTVAILVSGNGTTNQSYTYTYSVGSTWQHIVWVCDGTQGVANDRTLLYIGGTNRTGGTYSGTQPTALSTSTAPFEVGQVANAQRWPGNIDEVSIFAGSAFSAGQVATLYNGGKPGDLTALSPTHWWRLGENVVSFPTFPDLGSGNVALTAQNMVAGDIVEDAP